MSNGVITIAYNRANTTHTVVRHTRFRARVSTSSGLVNRIRKAAWAIGSARCAGVFRLAGVPGGHAHRFRDTFAVELLLAGVPLERVSVLLGHQSVKVTEKHYTPWVRARQEQLEADVRRTWDTDLLALPETKGTPEVQGQSTRPN